MKRIRQKYRDLMQTDFQNIIFWLSLQIVVASAILLLGGYFICRRMGWYAFTQCGFKTVTGIPCPGCGGTRAALALLQGDILLALYYHAFTVYLIIGYGVYVISQVLQRLTGGRIKGIPFSEKFLIVGLMILVVSYVIKLAFPGYII